LLTFRAVDASARKELIALAIAQHGVITRRQATQLRFDYRRIATAVRAGWLAEPVSGVLVVDDAPSTWRQRLMVVILAAGGHGVASHRSAARLHTLDGFETARNATIEATVQRAFRLDPAVAAVTHHVRPLEPQDVTVVDGIPCTTLRRTLCDLGSVVPTKLVRRALTSARRRGVDLAELYEDAIRLHRPHQSGTGVLLRLLRSIAWEGNLPATWFEELLGLCLNDPALPRMVMQYPIVDAAGEVVARTDIGFPSVRLGLEAHSRQFHFGPDAERLDEDRDLAAARCGWELLYLGWYATKKPAQVLGIVKEVIAQRPHNIGES
jgi:hypothetical protein